MGTAALGTCMEPITCTTSTPFPDKISKYHTVAMDEEKQSNAKLAWIESLLTKQDCTDILTAAGELGEDPSSKYFVERKKNIAYCVKLEGHWFHVHKNYFNQSSTYNDFSGGYKRYYTQMPTEWTTSPVVQKVLNSFQKAFKIPDGKLILVQVQSSHISCKPIQIKKQNSVITINHKNNEYDVNPDSNMEHELALQKSLEAVESLEANQSIEFTELCSPVPDTPQSVDFNLNDGFPSSPNVIVPTMSITGQGIHTDGKDHAVLVCLERDNICGAQNSAYYDLEGRDVLLNEFVLHQGNAMFWH
eukprot:148745_1